MPYTCSILANEEVTVKKIQDKYIRLAVIVVVAGAALYAIVSIISNIGLVYRSVAAALDFLLNLLTPLLIGLGIAFILSRPSDFFERLLIRTRSLRRYKKACHILGVLLAFAAFIGLIILFIFLVVPGTVDGVKSIAKEMPQYIKQLDAFLTTLSENQMAINLLGFLGIDITHDNSMTAFISTIGGQAGTFLQSIQDKLFDFIVSTGKMVWNVVLGLFFSLHMLLFKHELKGQLKTLLQNTFRKSCHKIMFVAHITNDMFFRFLVGKGLCSLAIGVITFVLCLAIGFKYSLLISIITCIANMIPMFGPFIGAIPALLLSLMTDPVFALYMLIILVGVQIVEGNILGPRILGHSLGINDFWILFSVVIFGALFGVFGMLLAAPVFGVLHILIKNWIYHRNHGELIGEDEYHASMARYREWTSKKPKRSQRDKSNNSGNHDVA